MTKKELLAKCKTENVRFVRLQFTELYGHLKNVQIPVEEISKALDNEMMFDGSSIRGYKRIEQSDMYFKPDISTFSILPWLGRDTGNVARIICDVLEPDDGIIGIGSGGNYALSAARALIDRDDMDAEAIARRAMSIAAGICIYTNENVTLESL